MAADAGQRIGDYEVLAQLGTGGMGRVYKVRNIISNREEAMKILLPDFAADTDLAARFMVEIRTLAGLEHPGIAQLRTAFQFQNQLVMIMEYVEGITLEKLASQIRIPQDHALDFAGQVLAALSYAHSRGVTHRDIKPANIMITTHGVVKLMDFGIAKSNQDMQLTRPGTTMGSVYYMSPEQVRGGTVDARSDLYSLGVTLYEVLTGSKPFQADTSYSVLHAQLNEIPKPLVEVNPEIPPQLNAIVLKAMEKRPEDRFQSADEFREALKAVREPVQAPAPAAPARTQAPAAVGAPAFAPVARVGAPARIVPHNRRGLWIGVGALAAVLGIIAVATVLPRLLSTHASQKPVVQDAANAASPTPAVSSTASPAESSPAAANTALPAAPPAVSSGAPVTGQGPTPARAPYAGTASRPASANAAQPLPAQSPVASPAPSAGAAAAPSGPSPQELRETNERLLNLEARADAALAGVQQIRSQQQAQGLDIRGDILASMNRLRQQINEAHRALNAKDIQGANDSIGRGDTETTRLEKFLGR